MGAGWGNTPSGRPATGEADTVVEAPGSTVRAFALDEPQRYATALSPEPVEQSAPVGV
jgi:hypothetical protein